jgi:hypothetical protein
MPNTFDEVSNILLGFGEELNRSAKTRRRENRRVYLDRDTNRY